MFCLIFGLSEFWFKDIGVGVVKVSEAIRHLGYLWSEVDGLGGNEGGGEGSRVHQLTSGNVHKEVVVG